MASINQLPPESGTSAIVKHGEFTLTNPAWMLCFNLATDPEDHSKIYRYTSSNNIIYGYVQPELPEPYYQGDYLPKSFEVSPIRHDNIGRIETTVTIDNTDTELSQAFLETPDWRGNTIWVSQFYVVRGQDAASYQGYEGRLVFYGKMNATQLDYTVAIECMGAGNFYGSTPRQTVRPPLFNWLPPDGMRIALDDQLIILERRK